MAQGDTVHVTVVNARDDPHTFTVAAEVPRLIPYYLELPIPFERLAVPEMVNRRGLAGE